MPELHDHDTYRHVRDQMVDIVRALPPADGQSTAEVGDKCTYEGVDDKVPCDPSMTCIMCYEHDLLLP